MPIHNGTPELPEIPVPTCIDGDKDLVYCPNKRLMKNLLLVEHGGDSKSFIFDMIQREDLMLFVAATYTPKWLLEYVPKERIIITDTYDTEKLIVSVQEYLRAQNISFEAVGTFYEHVVVQTAALGEHLGVVHLSVEAAKRSSSNKLLMRQTCAQAGIPTPKFITIENPSIESLKDTLTSFGLPAVIKPIFGSQSYGVKKIESEKTLEDDIKEIVDLTNQSKKEVFKNFNGIFLIEEYMSGKVVSVDGIVQNGVTHIAGMVEFVMGPEPHFTQEANYIPARLKDNTKHQCHEMARKIIAALGFNNCGFHTEMRLTANGPVLIEIAARLPGGPLQLGYQKAFGYNLASNMIKVWLNESITLTKKYERFVLQKAVFPRQVSTVNEILGVDSAKVQEGVWDFVLITKIGEETVTYPSIPKPLYYYAAEADSEKELEILSENLEKSIDFVM